MKKIICLIICFAVLICTASATVDFSEPSNEIIAKIKTAVINDKNKVFHSLYWTGSLAQEYDAKAVTFINVVANCSGNYVISFMVDDVCVDGSDAVIVGEYVVTYYSYGFAVYSSTIDKLMTIPDAYSKGLITDEDLYEIWQKHNGEGPQTNFIIKNGDINKDAVVDIEDVVYYGNHIVNSDNRYIRPYNKVGDLNNDGKQDVMDIAILRNNIVNG